MAEKRYLVTTQIENLIKDRDGNIVKRQFIHYSAPCELWVARAFAKSLKDVNQSYRIIEDDGRGKIVEQWCREGFAPDDKRSVEV